MRRLSLLALAGLLAACAVGPDYKGPPTIALPVTLDQDGDARLGAPPARWWRSLRDPRLDRLMRAALTASPTLEAARARVRQARAGLRQRRADRMPSLGGSALYLHAQTGSGTLGGFGGQSADGGPSGFDFNFYDAGLTASWEIDFFGGKRRALQSARADMATRQAELADAQVSLTAEIAQAYASLLDARREIELARKDAALQRDILSLARTRQSGGTASALDVTRLAIGVEQAEEAAIPLRAREQAQLNRLATLAGEPPGELDVQLAGADTPLLPPSEVLVPDPVRLLRHRPDIRAAERRIASRSALIGVRVADYFPKLRLLGSLGLGSADVGQLLAAGSVTTLAAPILQWSPFDFGRTAAKVEQARADRDEATVRYHDAVLRALEDAATATARYGRQRESAAGLAHVAIQARKAADLVRRRREGGAASAIDVLDAERQHLKVEQSLAQARAELTIDFIGLQKSLGLGWEETDGDGS